MTVGFLSSVRAASVFPRVFITDVLDFSTYLANLGLKGTTNAWRFSGHGPAFGERDAFCDSYLSLKICVAGCRSLVYTDV